MTATTTSLRSPSRRARRGLSMIELLIVITIILIMASLLLPALHMVRSNSLNTQCSNNVRQLNLAVELYYDAKRQYPLSRVGDGPGGWAWELLPWLEEQPLQDRFDLKLPLTAPVNLAAAQRRPPALACPLLNDGESTLSGVPMTHFAYVVQPIPRLYPTRTESSGFGHLETPQVPWCTSPEDVSTSQFDDRVHKRPFGF